MKKILVVMALFVAMVANAQQDVTTFLGIPVDGYRDDMISKLKAKGFKVNPYDEEGLTGEFNGKPVDVYISTNNNKVYRIFLIDKYGQSEGAILSRFNELCEQFENHKRYFCDENYKIPLDEDISYEMSVNDKEYEAVYFQEGNPDIEEKEIQEILRSKFTEEQLQNPSDEEIFEIERLSYLYYYEKVYKKVVWFRISQNRGKYYISMYYDNEYNRVNGEDL